MKENFHSTLNQQVYQNTNRPIIQILYGYMCTHMHTYIQFKKYPTMTSNKCWSKKKSCICTKHTKTIYCYYFLTIQCSTLLTSTYSVLRAINHLEKHKHIKEHVLWWYKQYIVVGHVCTLASSVAGISFSADGETVSEGSKYIKNDLGEGREVFVLSYTSQSLLAVRFLRHTLQEGHSKSCIFVASTMNSTPTERQEIKQ